MNSGWIKLHRSLLEWEWWSDMNVRNLWLTILLLANHDEKKWQGQTIASGQLVTSLQHLAVRSGLSVQQTRTALGKLKSTGEINIQSTNKNTLITVIKWADFQCCEENSTSNQQSNNKRATNEQQTDNKQITTTEELKNDRIIEYKNNSGSGNIYNINNIYSETTTAASMYQQNVGVLTPLIVDILRERVEAQGEEIVQMAIAEAVECGVRNIRYIEKILISWQDSGLNTVDSIKLHQSERRSQNGKNDDNSSNVKKSKFRNYPESYEITEEEKAEIDKMMKEYEECG